MRKIILFFVLLFTSSLVFAKLEEPRIIDNDRYELGEDITKVLKKVIPDFKLLELNNFSLEVRELLPHPMIAIGDFNGDKVKDAVIWGISQKKKKSYIIGFVSQSNKYKITKVTEASIDTELFQNNDEFISSNRPKAFEKIERDNLQLESFDGIVGFTNVYIYSDKLDKFVQTKN